MDGPGVFVETDSGDLFAVEGDHSTLGELAQQGVSVGGGGEAKSALEFAASEVLSFAKFVENLLDEFLAGAGGEANPVPDEGVGSDDQALESFFEKGEDDFGIFGRLFLWTRGTAVPSESSLVEIAADSKKFPADFEEAEFLIAGGRLRPSRR
ncbi:MAG: hypothetical protein Q7Q71_15435 [Verrucomicrobiota bacterium JB023]|nr:hypothetical protein [Verrucomicrobiota bacterium JB023]